MSRVTSMALQMRSDVMVLVLLVLHLSAVQFSGGGGVIHKALDHQTRSREKALGSEQYDS